LLTNVAWPRVFAIKNLLCEASTVMNASKKKAKTKAAGAPEHLSQSSRELFDRLVVDYSLADDAAALAILQAAMESKDRAEQARAAIDRDGLTMVGKAHPAVTIERDSRAAFLAGLKHLRLDLEPLRDGPGRPAGK
jgi:hypothetical protein